MIGGETFTIDWVKHISSKYKRGSKRAEPELVEKVTKALHLLEMLTVSNLDFVFKGGTSLLLLLNKLHRFSIDIDIIVDSSNNGMDMDVIMQGVVSESGIFERYAEQRRAHSSEVPKAHYKFYYRSVLDGKEKYVLLDVLFGEHHYKEIISREIKCELLHLCEPRSFVYVPNVDCILGDKLTAFAPNATGIPYGKGKELEIIKQLFDVANLFDDMKDIGMVKQTFKLIAQQELQYRGMEPDYSYENVLDDIFATSKIIGARGGLERTTFLDLEKGVTTIKGYIFSKNYIMETAVNNAAKAAYLSLLLKYDIDHIERYDDKTDLGSLKISNPAFKGFNKIIKFDPEAYFYWYKSIEILESEVMNSGG